MDRVAIVTGAGRGLGRAMALGLAEAGFRVVITAAREEDELAAVAEAIANDRGLALTADVTRRDDCERAAVPAMRRAGWGRIVNVSINRETMRRAGFSPYGPSKAALDSETAIWAQDLAGTGVTVNSLLPGGATATGMVPDGIPDKVRASLLEPEVIVPPLLWLVSQDADAVTGKRIIANRWRDDRAAAIEDA